jgi:transcriptional regulator with XRE-family HTH domain
MTLSALLRAGRRRLHPSITTLGAVERLPRNVGKPITQEELAEAVGVSRVWYALLERGVRSDVSLRLLARLADVLILDNDERSALIAAAMPDASRPTMSDDSSAMLDAFSWMRSATKRLWSATTEIEALALATESIAERLGDAALIHNRFRDERGRWQFPLVVAEPAVTAHIMEFIACLSATLGPKGMDQLHGFPRFFQAGEIYTHTDADTDADEPWLSRRMREKRAPMLRTHGFGSWSFLHGRVYSRRDWTAGLIVAGPERTYRDEEKAALSALTELTSLALW